jgi:hypothetical protein
MKSIDGGATFLPQAYRPYFDNGGHSNSPRTVLIPEPSDKRARPPWAGTPPSPPRIHYGFLHPSNVVREGDYCYALCSATNWTGQTRLDSSGVHCCWNEGGFAMIRSQTMNDPRAFEVFTSQGWKLTDVNTWQGWHIEGVGGQEVKLWHREEYSPHLNQSTKGQLLGFRLVYHQSSRQWIAFGFSNQGPRTVCYTLSDSLAEPNWEKYGINIVQDGKQGEHVVLLPGHYPSLVDPDSQDLGFQFVGDSPYLYYVSPNKPGSEPVPPGLGQPPTNLHSRSIWRLPLKISWT